MSFINWRLSNKPSCLNSLWFVKFRLVSVFIFSALDADRVIRIQERIYAELDPIKNWQCGRWCVLFSSQGYVGYRVDLDEGLQVGLRTRTSVSPAHPVCTQARMRRGKCHSKKKKHQWTLCKVFIHWLDFSVVDPWHLVRIRILGSVPLFIGSECGSGGPTYGSYWSGTLVKRHKEVTKQ